MHEALAAAQNTQQSGLLGTKGLTAAQKALQLELEGLVIDVSLAGKTVFRKDPVLFAIFADVVPKSPRRPGGAKTPAPTPVGP